MITRFLFFWIVVLFLTSCSSNSPVESNTEKESEVAANPLEKWIYANVDGNKIVFVDGSYFETGLYDLQYIDQIQIGNKAPFLIFSGRDCTECDANISLYIHSPDDGSLIVEDGRNRYAYPGTVFYYEDGSLISETKVFYGEVLPEIEGLIWYSKYLDDEGETQRSVYLVKCTSSGLIEDSFEGSGEMEQTLSLLKSSKCREISGLEFTSEP